MTLIAAEWVVISAAEPPRRGFAVRVEGDRIVDVGTTDQLRLQYPGDELVNHPGHVLLPGFVDAHTHLYGVLAHGIPTHLAPTDFWSFLDDFWWPRVENGLDHDMIAAATAWGAHELLAAGITTFFDILEAPYALPEALMVQKAAVDAIGIRAVLSFEATERVSSANGRLGLEENRRLLEDCRRSPGLVSGLVSFHTTMTGSPAFIRDAFELAAGQGVLCHAHVNESRHEPEWCLRHHGLRTMELYESLGVELERMLASQCVQLSPREQAIISERGVRCVHMPLSNCEVGGGIAPVPELASAGVTMGLGTDGYITDFFEVMRGAFLLHKARLTDPSVMPARQVLEMATEGSARALGLEKVGRLQPGWLADLQLVRLDLPTPSTEANLFDQLVLWRNRRDVTDVMVGGRWQVRNGSVVGSDVARLRARVAENAERLWAKT